MEYRVFGKTGLAVSSVGFGSWALGGPMEVGGNPVGWGRIETDVALRALDRAVELGVNFFDTADSYGLGHSESLLGQAFRGRRSRVLIASKVGNEILASGGHRKNFSRDYIQDSLHASLNRLETDYLDLYQLHNPSMAVIRQGEVFETLETLRRQGKIRYFGVSVSTVEEGLEIIRLGAGQGLQVLYNALNQKPAERLFPAARRAGYGIVVRVPLASGLLTGKMTPDTRFGPDDIRANFLTTKRLGEVLKKVAVFRTLTGIPEGSLTCAALSFALANQAVSIAIPGAKESNQVAENVSSCDFHLSDRVVESIRKDLGGYNFYLRYGIPL